MTRTILIVLFPNPGFKILISYWLVIALSQHYDVMDWGDYQSLASPPVSSQIRNCGLTKKVADMRTCELWQFKLRTYRCGLFLILVRNSASFTQILKFLSIFVKYMYFYAVKHKKSI